MKAQNRRHPRSFRLVGDKWGKSGAFQFSRRVPDFCDSRRSFVFLFFFFFFEESVNGENGIGDGNTTLMTVECEYPITLGGGGFSGAVCPSS